jgi:all-trans-retinol dehydrogenase (NAD+)
VSFVSDVAGGANGLGRAIAFRLAKEKCNVVIIDLNGPEAEKTASEIEEKFNVKTAAYKVDVSDYEAIQKLKVDIERTMGFVDILVNNAGILSTISLREGQPKDLKKIIDVNLTSHFWVILFDFYVDFSLNYRSLCGCSRSVHRPFERS